MISGQRCKYWERQRIVCIEASALHKYIILSSEVEISLARTLKNLIFSVFFFPDTCFYSFWPFSSEILHPSFLLFGLSFFSLPFIYPNPNYFPKPSSNSLSWKPNACVIVQHLQTTLFNNYFYVCKGLDYSNISSNKFLKVKDLKVLKLCLIIICVPQVCLFYSKSLISMLINFLFLVSTNIIYFSELASWVSSSVN